MKPHLPPIAAIPAMVLAAEPPDASIPGPILAYSASASAGENISCIDPLVMPPSAMKPSSHCDTMSTMALPMATTS